jgi:hypothetical protein
VELGTPDPSWKVIHRIEGRERATSWEPWTSSLSSSSTSTTRRQAQVRVPAQAARARLNALTLLTHSPCFSFRQRPDEEQVMIDLNVIMGSAPDLLQGALEVKEGSFPC